MFKRRETAPQHAWVYVARGGVTAIIVSAHYNGGLGGALIEDDSPAVLQGLHEPSALGEAVLAALARSEVRAQRSLAGQKLRDWPAFMASRQRSVRQFESDFIRLQVSGTNEANIILQIEGFPDKDCELRVLATANRAPASKLGESCLAVWRACRDRRF